MREAWGPGRERTQPRLRLGLPGLFSQTGGHQGLAQGHLTQTWSRGLKTPSMASIFFPDATIPALTSSSLR